MRGNKRRRQKSYLALVSLQLVVSCLHHSIKHLRSTAPSLTAQESSLQFITMAPICVYTPLQICYLTV